MSSTLRYLSLLLSITLAFAGNYTRRSWNNETYGISSFSSLIPPKDCPPCFNCLLPAFNCGQYGECNQYDGQCKCPPGWGGIDCLVP
ncbi:hypothetical protein E4T56_gene9016, partial [Termitomyces sp. T112]